MKIQSIQLEHFKRFRSFTRDFTDSETGLARDLVLLVGENGAGKTTLLQAIAATLGVATKRLSSLTDLEWPGYNYELLGESWGRFEPNVTLTVQFSIPEIDSIHEFYQKLNLKLQEQERPLSIPPARDTIAKLSWTPEGQVHADTHAQFLQFRGREYAKQILRSEGFGVFERVGTILWYTEHRTSTSLTPEDYTNREQPVITDDLLRDRLSKWRQFHKDLKSRVRELRPGQKDLYAEIEKHYQTMFPSRHFEGPVPQESIDAIFKEPWFYLFDGKNQYEISEMSGGERSLFPILMDFASWNVHNSVILIDEIELHLHPPLQQAFLRALPKLGTNNQFIITTHSDYVANLVPESAITRV